MLIIGRAAFGGEMKPRRRLPGRGTRRKHIDVHRAHVHIFRDIVQNALFYGIVVSMFFEQPARGHQRQRAEE